MRKIWKQPGNSTRSNSQERAKWSCRSGKNGAAARQTSVSAEHQAAIAWISVEFALNAKQTEALADYISRDGIAYVLEKAEIVRSEPSRPHARSRPIPKQFADWKDHAQLKRASVPALRYSPPSFGFGQSARIRRDHLLPWRKRADASRASRHSFGHRQPHPEGEQITASSVADLYLKSRSPIWREVAGGRGALHESARECRSALRGRKDRDPGA
jgi:hypothetical protein